RVKHKPPWVMFFNVGQYVVSATCAWLVMVAAGIPHGLVDAGRALQGSDLLWIVPTWVVWFVVNDSLVSGLAAARAKRFLDVLFEDFAYYVVTTAAVLALSPLVVLAAEASPWYVPLLLIPMFA